MNVIRSYLLTALRGWDFWLSCAFGGGIAWAGGNSKILEGGVTALAAESAITAAFLAVVLAALAIFVTFLDRAYRLVLERAHDGDVSAAFRPYKLIAGVAGVGCLVALVAAVVWPGLTELTQRTALAFSTFTAAWTVLGSVSLVAWTAWHGAKRAEILGLVERAGKAGRSRRQSGATARQDLRRP